MKQNLEDRVITTARVAVVEASKNCCQYEKAPHPLCKGCCDATCKHHIPYGESLPMFP